MGIGMEIYTEKEKTTYDVMKAINIILLVFVLILAFILISMSFLWTPMTVSGPSMKNTFQGGEHIILITSMYKYTYGDIIVFKKIDDEKNVIKRIIALPGDYIRFDESEGAWYRNGEKLIEDYVSSGYSSYYLAGSYTNVKVALLSDEGYYIEEDMLFVLGDNRADSKDSHVYGAINKSQIKGKYLFSY